MFQLAEKRAQTINLSDAERPEINSLLTSLQDKAGHSFTTIKDAFLFAIREAVKSPENHPEIEPVEIEVMPEGAVILGENQLILDISPGFENQLAEFKQKHALPAETELLAAVQSAFEISMKSPEIREVPKEVEKALGENQVLLDLNSAQVTTMKKIATRRFQSKREPLEDSPAVVITKMIFNKATLFNWGGEFWTGLSGEDFPRKKE